ncbi:LacI family DNA-binding transcriptional regulator [Occultella aeris]|uniref:HTH-type transcriptional repressor CytR n=1 Tax=Occultella aeris TaxID=2761496 RepID=A0A7M4DFH6_9MICO|nr:LacI family DNA-binding transcriptional regulator [Occultella aeris]VZO35669.1 HTH-type transcriptional repressor CytR [Occultella aeris]
MKAATIYSLAAELGISGSTVSRAFSRPDLVKDDVRERILATAAARGYAPNRAARGLATGRTGLIGLVVLDITNPFFPPLVRSIEHAAAGIDASVLLVDAAAVGPEDPGLVQRLSPQVDGLIVASSRLPTADLKAAIGATPAVLVNRTAAGLSSVVCDNSEALRGAADHLVELGHRRLVLLRGPAASWAAQRRTAAIRTWAKLAPADVQVFELGPFEAVFESGRDAVPDILESGATGILAFDDFMACGVIAGLAERGIAVPADRSIVGCDDVLLARTLTPPLTTVTAPFEDLGRHAVELLGEVIARGPRPANVKVAGSLTVRGSTAPVR